MREIQKVFFFGNRNGKCDELHKRLEEGIIILGGLQHPPHPESKQQAEEDKEDKIMLEKELEDIVLDIAAAFGFKAELSRNNE